MTEQEQLQQALQRINHFAVLITDIANNDLPVNAVEDGERVKVSATIQVPDNTAKAFVDHRQEFNANTLSELEEAANASMAQAKTQYKVAKKLLGDIEIVRAKVKTARDQLLQDSELA